MRQDGAPGGSGRAAALQRGCARTCCGAGAGGGAVTSRRSPAPGGGSAPGPTPPSSRRANPEVEEEEARRWWPSGQALAEPNPGACLGLGAGLGGRRPRPLPPRGGVTLAPIFGAGRPQRRPAWLGVGAAGRPRGHSGPGPAAPRPVTCSLLECPPRFLHLSPTRCFLFYTPGSHSGRGPSATDTSPITLPTSICVLDLESSSHLEGDQMTRDPLPSVSVSGKWAEGCGARGEVTLAVGNLPGLGSSADPAPSPSSDPGQTHCTFL